jgi:hypothetical protein
MAKSTTNEEQRICTHCRKKLPAWQFLANPIMPNGIDPFCYRCRAHAEDKLKYEHPGPRAILPAYQMEKTRRGFAVIRGAIRERDGNCCRICGAPGYLEVHHIVPVAQGGTNEAINLIALCQDHHRAVHRGEFTQEELSRYAEDPEYDPEMDDILPGYDRSALHAP